MPVFHWTQLKSFDRTESNAPQTTFTGPTARGLSLVAVVVGGLMFAYGEGQSKRTMADIVFGVGMAVSRLAPWGSNGTADQPRLSIHEPAPDDIGCGAAPVFLALMTGVGLFNFFGSLFAGLISFIARVRNAAQRRQ